MRGILIFLFAFLQFWSLPHALASFADTKIIELESGIVKENFGQNLQYFYDGSTALRLNDILASQYQDKWKQVVEDRPNWGFRDGKIWLYGRIL